MSPEQWVSVEPSIPVQSQILGKSQLIAYDGKRMKLSGGSSSSENQIDSLEVTWSGIVYKIDGATVQDGKLHFFEPFSTSEFSYLTNAIRKDQHIQICQEQDVEHTQSFWQKWSLDPCALPELNADKIDTTADLFGHHFKWPFLITGMTGGVRRGQEINEILADSASRHQVPMGVGSQRIALEDPRAEAIFTLKKKYPNLFLIGNIGIGQTQSASFVDDCQRACDMIDANALAIHVNVLQELIQVEGDRDFSGSLNKIEKVSKSIDRPVVIKEVGVGIDHSSAKRLRDVGIKTIDVGGAGGTSWAKIEGLRSKDKLTSRLGETFSNFGNSTGDCLQSIKEKYPDLELIATGGIRSGLDAAKAIGLGAKFCGIGLPFFKSALKGPESLEDEWSFFQRSLQIAMITSNCQKPSDLKNRVREVNA